jgi:DNA-binding transcriptional LysR family regulator
VSQGHPLAGRRSIALADVPGNDFVGLGDDSALQQLVGRQLRRINRQTNYRVRVRSLESVCALVGQRVGVGIVPSAVALRTRRTAGIRHVMLQDAWAQRSLMLCMRKRAELPAHAEKLLAYLLKLSDVGAAARRHRG